jgi:hypothetical protein
LTCCFTFSNDAFLGFFLVLFCTISGGVDQGDMQAPIAPDRSHGCLAAVSAANAAAVAVAVLMRMDPVEAVSAFELMVIGVDGTEVQIPNMCQLTTSRQAKEHVEAVSGVPYYQLQFLAFYEEQACGDDDAERGGCLHGKGPASPRLLPGYPAEVAKEGSNMRMLEYGVSATRPCVCMLINSMEGIKVCVRVRPFSKREKHSESSLIANCLNLGEIELSEPDDESSGTAGAAAGGAAA